MISRDIQINAVKTNEQILWISAIPQRILLSEICALPQFQGLGCAPLVKWDFYAAQNMHAVPGTTNSTAGIEPLSMSIWLTKYATTDRVAYFKKQPLKTMRCTPYLPLNIPHWGVCICNKATKCTKIYIISGKCYVTMD